MGRSGSTGADRTPEGPHRGLGVAPGPDQDLEIPAIVHRAVDLRRSGCGERFLASVGDHTDDLPARAATVVENGSPDRVLPGKEGAHEGLVHHDRAVASRRGRREGPTPPERDPEGPKVIRRDCREPGVRRLVGQGLAHDLDWRDCRAMEGNAAADRNGLDARERRDSLRHLGNEEALPVCRGITIVRRRKLRDRDPRRIEAEVHVHQVDKAECEQEGGSQQHRAKADLEHDEHTGQQASHGAGDEGGAEHLPVQGNRDGSGELIPHERYEQRDAGDGDQCPTDAADQGE